MSVEVCFNTIPEELIEHIFLFLDLDSAKNCACVNRLFRRIILNEHFLQKLFSAQKIDLNLPPEQSLFQITSTRKGLLKYVKCFFASAPFGERTMLQIVPLSKNGSLAQLSLTCGCGDWYKDPAKSGVVYTQLNFTKSESDEFETDVSPRLSLIPHRISVEFSQTSADLALKEETMAILKAQASQMKTKYFGTRLGYVGAAVAVIAIAAQYFL